MGAEGTSENMDTPEEKEILAIERTDYFRIGLSLTVIILMLAVTYAVIERDAIHALKPNEFGDFLAGIFGPLVLLWVVMGFLQQGSELKYSREALLLQAKELKASVEAQQNMGEAAWAGVHAERDARIHANVERLKSMQPVFTLVGGGYGTSGNIIDLHLTLSNLGKDALNVKLQLLNSDLSLNPDSFVKFTARQEARLTIQTLRTSEYGDCLFELSYKDVEGNSNVRHYQLQRQGDALDVVDPIGAVAPPP
jgi:hypothetical protein